MKIKKFYLSALLTALTGASFGQGFFQQTTYRGAFEPGQPQWTDTWTNWDPQNTNYGSSNVTVTTSITTNTTWTANNVYLLQGQIYVKNNATLTIEPGTIIMGDKNSTGAGLFVTKGAKVMAVGTVSQPIIFTSNQPAGQRQIGDWGGVILLGKASNNNPGGIANIEGIAPTSDTEFGGGTTPDDADNSGTLKYVRIEFGGYVYAPNKEINGLTFGAVGSGTTIDYVQVSFANDDAYEWFGGSVNCRHLVAYRNLDDEFDTDNGYHGNCQFLLSVRDPQIADNPSVSTSEGFESDNDPNGDDATPQTTAIFSNVTFVGPLRGNPGSTVAVGYRRGARLRRNSALKVYNCIFMDDLRGIHIDGTPSEENATAGTSLTATTATGFSSGHTTTGVLKYKNNIVAGNLTGLVTEVNSGSTFNAKTWFGANNNDSVVSSANILVNPYGDNGDFMTNLDYRPSSSSIAATGASFTDAVINGHLLAVKNLVNNTIELKLFPNPTSENATVEFELVENATVSVNIYDFNGRLVSNIASSNLNAGNHSFVVNTNNVNAGMYYVVITSNNDSQTIKMNVIK